MDSTKQKKVLLRTTVILSAVVVIGLILGLFVFFKFRIYTVFSERGSRLYTPSEIRQIKAESENDGQKDFLASIKERLESGTGINPLLREYYSDQFIYTIDGRYYFSPINFELKQNKLDNSNFVKNSDGEIQYVENGVVTSHMGIDISRYQGNIDFSKVKQSGVEFAMIRCGYRGYGGGSITDDTSFDTYARDALTNDIKIGAYFFSQAITVEEAVEEANYVIDKLKPYNVDYPVVIDIEEVTAGTSRQESLSNTQLTDVVIAFCEQIKSAGYTPMIYSNSRYFAGKFEMERLEDYEKWFAFYADVPYMPYEFSMWQYTNKGTIDGISGDVDINISFKSR